MNCSSNPSYENQHPLVDGVPAITTNKKVVRSKNILSNRRGRLAAFGILYISEGIPYGFSSTAMVAFMRIEGLSLQQIGAFVAAIAATQFTAYMALSNVAISIGNYWQGAVAERFNYQTALCLDAALIILALCVIPFLKDRDETRKPASDTDPLVVAAAQLKS